MIEDEVERRVAEKLNKLLQHISKTYDVSLKQLLRDSSSLQVAPDNTCMGITSKKQRCRMKSHGDTGYCKHHHDQKPAIRKQVSVVNIEQIAATAPIHNHPNTILFAADCPGCAKKKKPRLKIDI